MLGGDSDSSGSNGHNGSGGHNGNGRFKRVQWPQELQRKSNDRRGNKFVFVVVVVVAAVVVVEVVVVIIVVVVIVGVIVISLTAVMVDAVSNYLAVVSVAVSCQWRNRCRCHG